MASCIDEILGFWLDLTHTGKLSKITVDIYIYICVCVFKSKQDWRVRYLQGRANDTMDRQVEN